MSDLPDLADEMLIAAYRGRLRSIPCDALGDKAAYDRKTGTWKNVGTVSEAGRAWFALCEAGLITDYDSFGGFHYCDITNAGEAIAGQLIAIAAGSRRAKTPKAVECEASQSGGGTPHRP